MAWWEARSRVYFNQAILVSLATPGQQMRIGMLMMTGLSGKFTGTYCRQEAMG